MPISSRIGQTFLRAHLRLHNSNATALAIYIEPWGEQFFIPPEKTYEVVFEGPDGGGHPEIELKEQEIFVYAWSGSTFAVFSGGDLLKACDIPIPPIPPTI
jgi:hypothetical protein